MKRTLLAALLSMLFLLPDVAQAATPVVPPAAKTSRSTTNQKSLSDCRNLSQKTRQLSLGSQVDGRLFSICVKTSLFKPVIKKTTMVKNRNTKLTLNTTTQAKPKVVTTKPKSLNKRQASFVNPIGQVKVTTIRVQNRTQLVFRPIAPKATKWPNKTLRVNQQVKFSVGNEIRYGFGFTQGRKLGVRFVPISFVLRFSDGLKVTQRIKSRAFKAAGRFRMVATVTYQPYYRLLKAGEWVNRKAARWVKDPGSIALASNTVWVQVVDGSPANETESLPVLIS